MEAIEYSCAYIYNNEWQDSNETLKDHFEISAVDGTFFGHLFF